MKKRLYKFLIKIDMLVHTIFSLLITFFGGLHFCVVENIYNNEIGWIGAVIKAGFTLELFTACVILIISLVYDYYISQKASRDIEKNRSEIINGLLASLTKAIFSAYGNDIDVSSVVQICNRRKKQRTVKYEYNTDMNMTKSQIMGLEFGDVGETCVKEGKDLLKRHNYEEWKQNDKEYQSIVPKNLRLIVAKPIYIGNTVVAVLEMDVFESTTESIQGRTKEGYITDKITIDEVAQTMGTRTNQNILGNWVNYISLLLE